MSTDDRARAFAERFSLTDEAADELRALLEPTSLLTRAPPRGPSGAPSPVTLALDDLDTVLDEPAPIEVEGTVQRYDDLGPLGEGGMGEVRRVRDRDLNRIMVMKIMQPELRERPALLARFVEEAQATAQLEHPSIVPVHELGQLSDGRLYFTMKEVRGRTLTQVIRAVHEAADEADGTWQATDDGWSLRRLLDAFHRVCEAIGYAHARGVVHRDLKPENVMVGAFGEVQVMDWGLAKIGGRDATVDAPAVVTDRSRDAAARTRMGAIAGTPAYMPPEQARGDIDAIDARSDVYALGAVLFEILDGRPPYRGSDSKAVLEQVLSGPPTEPGRPSRAEAGPPGTRKRGPPLPDDLVETCRRAMARDPAGRHPDARALAEDIAAWLDGSRRAERARAILERARSLRTQAAVLRDRAATTFAEAEAALSGVAGWDPVEAKRPAWRLQDEARAHADEAEARELEAERTLHGALTHAPDLADVHRELVEIHIGEHRRAERTGDRHAATAAEGLLREHGAHLDGRGTERLEAYLKGDGSLTLHTDPQGAEVLLHRYELQDRRLVPVFERSLGTTPLRGVPLAMGSYLLLLRAEGCAEVRYPVHIGRQEVWHGVAPATEAPHAVPLPFQTELEPDECYVPAGWFEVGGDAEALNGLPAGRVWMDGFVVKRQAVTHAEYIAFLNDLSRKGKRKRALELAPKVPPPLDLSLYQASYRGVFSLRGGGPYAFVTPDMPVFLVDWVGALAYARWYAEKTGCPWQLVSDHEFEKAARGVDGRAFPFGPYLDPTWANVQASGGQGVPARAEDFAGDVSPYGVTGLAGNVRTWCRGMFRWGGAPLEEGRPTEDTLRDEELLESAATARGGYCFGDERYSRCATRDWILPFARDPSMGIRLARALA